jgi:drug/metabolite transporter (DMT)-like permease
MAVIRANLPLLMAYGAVGFACFNNLLYSALNHTTAINVAIDPGGHADGDLSGQFHPVPHQGDPGADHGFLAHAHRRGAHRLERQLHGRLIGLELNRGDALMLLAVLCYGGYTVSAALQAATYTGNR